MSELEKRRIDREFQLFTVRNFEKPKKCKNIDQVRFYVNELAMKMDDFKDRFNYVPNAAYKLLAEYNALQNTMVFEHFKNTY